MLFGPKLPAVFRSRWNALFWAAGVLLTAYCTVPSQDRSQDDGTGEVAKSLLGASEQAQPAHSNPWSKDAPAN